MAKDLRRKIHDQVLPHIHGGRKIYINIGAATANRDSGTIGGFTGE